MQELYQNIANMIARFTLLDAIDILLVATLIYYVLKLASRTRAMQVLKGVGVVLIAARVSEWIGLRTFYWVFNYIISIGAILMVVIFQAELRKAFEHIGRKSKLIDGNRKTSVNDERMISELVSALITLSKQKIGALIALEREVALGDIVETGTLVGAEISAPLLGTIFLPGTPLHDGAVVIRHGTVEAAGCFLPLTDNTNLPQHLGTRHRAALGLSEVSDALVFVVSEETGMISCASQGMLTQNLDAMGVRTILEDSGEMGTARGVLELFRKGGPKE
ncbi:diadenylate cyclase CdaA [Eubacteriales bacterium OttesenSCG-928-M02]|nr:diadenylate cyclase CdaA [Eubacteriales bacterium OttesenSCG-928-M02]